MKLKKTNTNKTALCLRGAQQYGKSTKFNGARYVAVITKNMLWEIISVINDKKAGIFVPVVEIMLTVYPDKTRLHETSPAIEQ